MCSSRIPALLLLLSGLLAIVSVADTRAASQGEPEAGKSMQVQHRGAASAFTLTHSDGWILAPNKDDTSTFMVHESGARLQAAGVSRSASSTVLIQTEKRLDENDAIQRLRNLAGASANAVFYTVDGWPAIERYEITQPDKIGMEDRASGRIPILQRITIAVAAGTHIIRLEGKILSDSDPDVNASGGGTYLDMRRMAESMRFARSGDPGTTARQLESLRASHQKEKARHEKNRLEAETAGDNLPRAGLDQHAPPLPGDYSEIGLVINTENFSEIEAVASTDGQNIVIATNSRSYSVSNDGGQTFAQDSITINGGDVAYDANGDPSLAYGQSGDFYFAFIAYPTGTGGAGNATQGCTTGVTASTDDGQNYSHRGHATFCVFNDPDGDGPLTTCFPDQEHIAADRWNPSATAQDQVYSAWRDFTPGAQNLNCRGFGSGSVQSRLTCSADSGQTWGIRRALTGDFPRVTVGQDGFVYVVTRSFGDDPDSISIDKYSSCDTGLVQQDGFPRTVFAGSRTIDCPVPGLDRCNDGNDLRSASAAVDDLDPSHIFVSVAQHTTTGTNAGATPSDQVGENDDILVFDSTNGGVNWNGPVTLNPGFAARRYMPWPCTVGGTAYVGWYDRRGANALDNSLTDYYLGSASRTGAGLVAGPEFRVSTDSDSNCGAGWINSSPRSTADSESCTVQPQQAGFCSGAGTRCDFSDVNCPGGETCDTGGGGPKYGDYSGIACAAGRVYAAWASATPPGGPQTTDIDSFLQTDIVCCVPQIQTSNALGFGEICGIEQQVETLDVCNTGVEDLEINSIDSSDAQFGVNLPSSGLPIVVSKDFCFPLEVTYDPSAGTSATGVLTINTNDPVNPAVQVSVSGSSGVAEIDTFIANSGDFGSVCSGDLFDLDLTVQNNGSCDLEIDSISLSGADAGDFELPDGSFAGTIVEPGNSLQVPVRFAPDNFTDPSPRNATVDVASRTRDGDPLAVSSTPISGVVPPPDINVAIANSGDFGAVCKGETADLDLTLFNQGQCDLTITGIGSDNPLFVLPADTTYPLVLSPDADFILPVRYAPVDCNDGVDAGTITISSDSPGETELTVDVTGTSPCPNLVIDPSALTGAFAFPATVVDTEGTLGCYSERSTVLRNTGGCPLTISDITATGDDYTVMAPTIFPIVVPPGEETLVVDVRFTPQALGDPRLPEETLGTLTVISDDPDASGEAVLCGEGVTRSGIRVLVTETTTGIPLIVDSVDTMTVKSKGKNTPSPINLRFTDVEPQSTTVCGNAVDWHLDLETLPAADTTGADGGKSQYQVSARDGNLQDERSLTLDQCEFSTFQMQLQGSSGGDGGQCLLAEKGEACTDDGDCCSGKCRGPSGAKSCK